MLLFAFINFFHLDEMTCCWRTVVSECIIVCRICKTYANNFFLELIGELKKETEILMMPTNLAYDGMFA